MSAASGNPFRPLETEGDSLGAAREMCLVDAEEPSVARPGDELLTHNEAHDLELLRAGEAGARAADAVANLTLSAPNLRRAHEVRVAFEAADDDGDIGERLLEELVSGEVGVALELQNIEGALASLLGKTVTDPRLALEVAKVFRETAGLSSAVRRRIENSLGAVATLRAQRILMSAQRARLGI